MLRNSITSKWAPRITKSMRSLSDAGGVSRYLPIGDFCPIDGGKGLTSKQKLARKLTDKELFGSNVLWTEGQPINVPTFIRQCTATGQWSIFAIEKFSQKPMLYKVSDNTQKNITSKRKEWDPECPFCPGNEDKCPDPLYEILVAQGGWKVRVYPNKYSFLRKSKNVICGFWGKHLQVSGNGVQEVVVLNPKHNSCPALMEEIELYYTLEALHLRGKLASQDPNVLYVTLFQNHGIKSGGSLEHPHFQIVGLPIVPTMVVQRIEHADYYYMQHGECAFCRTIIDEKIDLEGDGSRIIHENKEFISFVPYAATRAYQIWILPKRHSPDFFDITELELKSLTQSLHACLKMLYYNLNDPDYNIIIRTCPTSYDQKKNTKIELFSPLSQKWERSYHWYLEISPHTSEWGGISCFDMVVHNMLPEKMAKILKEPLGLVNKNQKSSG